MNIPDRAGHQITGQVSTLPYVCFCTSWEKLNKRNMGWNKKYVKKHPQN